MPLHSGSTRPFATSLPALSMEQSTHVSEILRKETESRFNHTMAEYGPALSPLASGYERVPEVRQELTQEIGLAIWQALPHFRGECSERTFVYRTQSP